MYHADLISWIISCKIVSVLHYHIRVPSHECIYPFIYILLHKYWILQASITILTPSLGITWTVQLVSLTQMGSFFLRGAYSFSFVSILLDTWFVLVCLNTWLSECYRKYFPFHSTLLYVCNLQRYKYHGLLLLSSHTRKQRKMAITYTTIFERLGYNRYISSILYIPK